MLPRTHASKPACHASSHSRFKTCFQTLFSSASFVMEAPGSLSSLKNLLTFNALKLSTLSLQFLSCSFIFPLPPLCVLHSHISLPSPSPVTPTMIHLRLHTSSSDLSFQSPLHCPFLMRVYFLLNFHLLSSTSLIPVAPYKHSPVSMLSSNSLLITNCPSETGRLTPLLSFSAFTPPPSPFPCFEPNP